MLKVDKALKFLFSKDYRFLIYAGRGKYNEMPDDEYLKRKFKSLMGYDLDLDNPKTFNEKIQWLKLHEREPIYSTYVDKYEVKEYIASTLGREYVVPLLGVWDRFEDIDFDKLPERFVLKCTHNSGGLVICKDKKALDVEKAKKKINKSLKKNYYLQGREWPYKNVKPRIIAEQYMEDYNGSGNLSDYKLHFFSGECKAIMVGQNRFSENGLDNDYYTPEWEHFDFTRGHSHNAENCSPKPEQLEKMIELGEKLAAGFPFIRIDFYIVNGKIYFGEITFFPGSGFKKFTPDYWDEKFGEWIKLPREKIEN